MTASHQDTLINVMKALPASGDTHTNSHNNNNTLNFYLTQTCKNAESIHDFTDLFVERSSEFFNNNYRSIADDHTNFAANLHRWRFKSAHPPLVDAGFNSFIGNGYIERNK